MNIETVRLPQIIEAVHLSDLDYFMRHAAFVISHKSESLDTLRTVLRFLPAESPLIIVSNCPPRERAYLRAALDRDLAGRPAAFLVHQKDERIAHFFRECGVPHILGGDGAVVDGKGEGMYIGALLAALLRQPEWLIYYDADNHAPSALLEYTLAMGRLYMAARAASSASAADVPVRHDLRGRSAPPALHNIRVCWASKLAYDGGDYTPRARVMGRCTQVVAPFCDELLRARQPWTDQPLTTPNAGEQGMTMRTAMTLRFSSGFSVETFQLLDLFFQGTQRDDGAQQPVLLQQYMSGSPHFHQKKDDGHIRGMIAESLGSFLVFKRALPPGLAARISSLLRQLEVSAIRPAVYPALRELPLAGHESLVEQYRLGSSEEAASA
jgi:mannosyl-3-phosphoglycerate synthase